MVKTSRSVMKKAYLLAQGERNIVIFNHVSDLAFHCQYKQHNPIK
jgi:hypothetical protein